jgi:hypothetical protein
MSYIAKHYPELAAATNAKETDTLITALLMVDGSKDEATKMVRCAIIECLEARYDVDAAMEEWCEIAVDSDITYAEALVAAIATVNA